MLIDFFFTLRSAKLPVSVKEYLILLEALQARRGRARQRRRCSIDDFYYLVAHHAGQGREALRQVRPRLRRLLQGRGDASPTSPRTSRSTGCARTLELELTPEEKAKIEKMGWDELMETLKKRFEEQKERHEGGSKMDRHRRHLALRRLRLQPAGHPHRPAQGPQQERGQGVGPARLQGLRRHAGTGHAQHQGGAAPAAQVRARGRATKNWTSTTPSAPPRPTPAGSTSRWCPSGTTT